MNVSSSCPSDLERCASNGSPDRVVGGAGRMPVAPPEQLVAADAHDLLAPVWTDDGYAGSLVESSASSPT